MKKEEMICTCEIGVSTSEILNYSGEKGILELINEFESRCPGYEIAQYQDAISRSIFLNR